MNNFRIGRHFLSRQPGFRVFGQNPNYAEWPVKGKEIPIAFKNFTRWDVTNVARFLRMDDGGSFMTMLDKKIDFLGMPSYPPMAQIWIEAHDDTGDWAMPIQYDDDYPGRYVGLPIYWSDSEEFPNISDNRFFYEWDENGVMLANAGRDRDDDESDDVVGLYHNIFARITNVMVTSFIFAHCKNVTLEERFPSRQARRAAERKGEPVLKWHEIVIDPNATRQPSTGANRTDDKPQKALHIARGHFAHYTEERPLFGKYTGTFWRPAHVRGSADVGVVKSTYKVKPGT